MPAFEVWAACERRLGRLEGWLNPDEAKLRVGLPLPSLTCDDMYELAELIKGATEAILCNLANTAECS